MIATHAWVTGVAVTGCALAVAGCGSSARKSAFAGSFLRFAQCMRSSGVPNFPDPPAGGGIKLPVGGGLNPTSPAFQAAQQSCRKDLPDGGPPRVVPESDKLSMVRHAECMRAHGVPSYPDPTFPPGGGIAISFGNVNPNSPAFQGAAKACGGII